jgi:hypothetical protein
LRSEVLVTFHQMVFSVNSRQMISKTSPYEPCQKSVDGVRHLNA